jgi:hypothetical protein
LAALARSALKILTGCCTAPPQPCGRPETTRRRSSLCVSQLRPLVRSASAVLLCCREDRRDDGSALSSWCTPPTWRGRRTRRARWYDGRRWLGGGTLGNGAASVYYWTALQMALHAISSKRKESRRGRSPRPNPRPWGGHLRHAVGQGYAPRYCPNSRPLARYLSWGARTGPGVSSSATRRPAAPRRRQTLQNAQITARGRPGGPVLRPPEALENLQAARGCTCPRFELFKRQVLLRLREHLASPQKYR